MQYQINQSNYHAFSVFEVNKLPARTYFIPYPDRVGADAASPKEKRYASSKVLCLNGEWDFKFYPKPAELPAVLDTDTAGFDRIDVPACWQFRGYDRPFYVNIRYQFPYKPPVIPMTEKVGKVFSWLGADQKVGPRWKEPGEEYNFVGVYRRFLHIDDPSKNYVIDFMGVASCMDLYLNGGFVGYSEGSHNIAGFDLSGKLKAGENEIVVVVHRWCTGTYLEDQDMFRSNGIFRDVLLRVSEPTDLWDIDAKTVKTGDAYSLTLRAEALSDTKVTFTLEGHGISRTASVFTKGKTAEVTFAGLPVAEWTAEDPVLYSVYFETPTGCVKEKIGFRTVAIDGDVFLVNGRKIKLKGVNHHDTSPVNGYAMTPDEIERDVLLCKQFNIDTIRTAHYPPDPLLLELADEAGVYIVDENDLETHGTFAHQLPPTYNSISHDPRWRARYVDRIARLYQRDKIHGNTAIVMWSLGNEAGGYHNTDAMYDYLKARSNLPVHYESAVHCKREAYDVGSEMYPSVQMVRDAGEKKRKQKRLNDRPYFMCEYAHAMGTGPGNTEAYWQEIYRYDSLMGGCVWEMADHAVLQKDGTYTYGGDHGEWEHDGNFCADGLFYPDRTPSTGARIIKFIYRPIRVAHVSGDQFEIFNTTAFSNASRYQLEFRWNDGSAATVRPDIAPLSRAAVKVALGKPVDGAQLVTVTATDTKTGRVVSEEQIILARKVRAAPPVGPLPEGYAVGGGRLICKKGGRTVLTTALQGTLLYRAATDNDTDLTFRNGMLPYMAQTEELVSAGPTANGWKVVTRVSNKKQKFTVTDTYEGVEDGVLVTSVLHCVSGGGTVPRFGKCFRLDEVFDRVRYVGRCGESYNDMKDQFPIRDVTCTVADMTEPNIRPQESGNRMDCTAASVSDGTVKVTFEAVDKPFELGIKPYTDQALCGMRHREDEARTGTYVTIQAFQQGIGTGSCGPGIMPEFQYSAKRGYTLKFLIRAEEANRTVFGYMPDGRAVEEVTLRRGALSCSVITYGGAVRTLTVPDKSGKPTDVVLGFDTLEDYRRHDKFLGALVGRYANRIGGACFTLNGVRYSLPANDGPNHIHGGYQGFDKKLWTVKELKPDSVVLSLDSPDGEEGYPGNLRVQVTYALRDSGLEIEYFAQSDRDTLCNLTNHSYFNLSGHGSGPVTGQVIQLMAERYTPASPDSIPTGVIAPVEGTPMDLRTPRPIGAHIDDPFGQLTMAGGYDHNWAADGWDGRLRPAARAWSPDTGISMEVQTTLPGVQFYTGNYLDGCPVGKGGALYGKRCGFCLETQFFPNSPNLPGFPSAVLAAGEEYHSKTVFSFCVTDGL